MKTEKIELKSLVLRDLDGNPVNYGNDQLCKAFGNAIFVNNPTIELEEISRIIHRGEEAEVTENDLLFLIHINTNLSGYCRFIKQGINEYLHEKLNNLKT